MEYRLIQVADMLFISTTSKTYLLLSSTSRMSPILISLLDNIISTEISFIVIILPILFIFLYELYEFILEVKRNLKEV